MDLKDLAERVAELEARNRQQETALRQMWATNAQLRGRIRGLVGALERMRRVRPTRRLSAQERAEAAFR